MLQLGMKEIVGDYERTNGCPKVAITSGNCLIDRRLQIILGRSKRLFFFRSQPDLPFCLFMV